MIFVTLTCTNFQNARIVLDKFHVILHSPDSIAPVGVLHPLAFHLEHKSAISSLSSSNANIHDGLEKLDHIYEVQGDGLQSCLVKCQPMSLAENSDMANKSSLCISTFKRDTFSVGCWSQSSSKSSEGKLMHHTFH